MTRLVADWGAAAPEDDQQIRIPVRIMDAARQPETVQQNLVAGQIAFAVSSHLNEGARRPPKALRSRLSEELVLRRDGASKPR